MKLNLKLKKDNNCFQGYSVQFKGFFIPFTNFVIGELTGKFDNKSSASQPSVQDGRAGLCSVCKGIYVHKKWCSAGHGLVHPPTA